MERSNRPRRTLGALRAELVFSGESLRINGRGLLLGLVVGLLVGAWGGLFARLLEGAALVRQQTTWAMFLLPLAGIVVVWLYRRGGIKTAGGTDLIIQAARGEQPVSRLLAPVIFLATLLTHCFGGSAGREGAALQLGGSLAEFVRKGVRMGEEFQDLAIMCGMSAGFSAVFGSQITAALFALEISCVGMLPLGALFPCVVSSITAGTLARAVWAGAGAGGGLRAAEYAGLLCLRRGAGRAGTALSQPLSAGRGGERGGDPAHPDAGEQGISWHGRRPDLWGHP